MDKQKNLEDLFRAAKEQQPVFSYKEVKEQFIASSITHSTIKSSGLKHLLSIKNWIIIISTVATISLTFLLLFNDESNVNSEKANLMEIKKEVENSKEKQEKLILKNKNVEKRKEEDILKLETDELVPVYFPEYLEEKIQYANLQELLPKKIQPNEEDYIFPKLTQEEIDANHKQKKQMLKSLEKFDKKVYAYIPSGTFEYNGKTTSVQSFLMQKTEVTNLEYRTFLFDLLIQERKEEFLKAKPDQHQWVIFNNGGMRSLEENYFSSKDYNYYPVVNISREGAELYCIWLTQELVKHVGDVKQNEYNDIRIPLKVEWVKAASVEGNQLPYPWKGENIKNSTGAILANCVIGYSNDSLKIDTNSPDYNIMAPVKSYWPNEYGIYNLAGNVAEMVYEDINNKGPGTAGGSWKTYYEGVKILAPDAFKGVSSPIPTIGFRVVMTMLKNP